MAPYNGFGSTPQSSWGYCIVIIDLKKKKTLVNEIQLWKSILMSTGDNYLAFIYDGGKEQKTENGLSVKRLSRTRVVVSRGPNGLSAT